MIKISSYRAFKCDPKDTDGLGCNTEKDRKTRLHERSADNNKYGIPGVHNTQYNGWY